MTPLTSTPTIALLVIAPNRYPSLIKKISNPTVPANVLTLTMNKQNNRSRILTGPMRTE
jgi:hypothetical protein